MRCFAYCVVASLGVALSCASGPAKVGAQPSWRAIPGAAPPHIFAPASASTERYNAAPGAIPASELGDATIAMVERTARTQGRPAPIADARLFAACEELAAIVPESGAISYPAVEFAMQRHGIVEPSPRLLVVWGTLADAQDIVDEIAASVPEIVVQNANLRFGIGAAPRAPNGVGAVVVAFQASHVVMAPVARALPAGGVIAIDAALRPPFVHPEVFVTSPNGQTRRMGLLGDASKFTSLVECGSDRGKLQIEITGEDATGSTVLANFPVWCNEAAPTSIALPLDNDVAPADANEAGLQLLGLVNQDRKRAGLPALVWDDRVAAVARAHSMDMQQTNVVAHISPTTGSAADRVKRAGIRTGAVLENVARAYGVREAHAGLMNSPGHRANVMSALATHLGVGVVYGVEFAGRKEMFVTQVFIRVPQAVVPAAVAASVLAKLQSVHAVSRDARLDRAAQQLASRLAQGEASDKAWQAVKRDLESAANAFRRVGSVVSVVSEYESLDAKSLLGTFTGTAVGIGVGQGTHGEIGEGAIWLVLLMGEAR